MKNFLLACSAIVLISIVSCVSTSTAVGPNAPAVSNDGSRNFVMVMFGESCDTANVANNMYVENSHETKSIIVTVDITWTENGQPRHENRTVTVAPNNKTLLGCEWRGGTYQRFEIMTSRYQ